MWAKIITIKRTKDFSLCVLNLFNTRVPQFELNYWNKWTFPRYSNLLRCTCILGTVHWKNPNCVRFSTHGSARARTAVQLKSDNVSAIWFVINNMWNKQGSANVCFCWCMCILASQYITTTAMKEEKSGQTIHSCSMRVYAGIWAFIPSSPGCWWRTSTGETWTAHVDICV